MAQVKHLTVADMGYWRAVNARLINDLGHNAALGGEIRDYIDSRVDPMEAARRIAEQRVYAMESAL